MGTEPVELPYWSAEPEDSTAARARFAWYAAVARWAPSKHNTQPWRFVVRDGALDFWADPMRTLPESDPYQRELVISVGATVELACVAARVFGYQPRVSFLPDHDGGCLARLVEVGAWEATEQDRLLLSAVARRRTDRGPLDGAQLPGQLALELEAAAVQQGAALRIVSSAGERSSLAQLIERADRLLVQRRGIDEELAQWLREPTDPRRDGVPADHTRGAAASYRAEFVQRDFSSISSRPAQDRPGKDKPLIGVLCTPSDDVPDWLIAGRALAAVLLRATVAGANASYLNQPVEDSVIRAQLGDQLHLPGYAQAVLRIGIGGEIGSPPRRRTADLIFQTRAQAFHWSTAP